MSSNPAQSVILLLIGLPASGKSTIAQHIRESPLFREIFDEISVIDTDTIRHRLFGPVFHPKHEPEVVAKKKQEVIHALHRDQTQKSLVIIDDMHYYISMRHEYYEIARKMNALYLSVHVNVPVQNCYDWNERRKSPIPKSVIEDVAAKFDAPGKKYRWDRPHLVVFPHIHSIPTIGTQICDLVSAEDVKPRNDKQEAHIVKKEAQHTQHAKESLDKATKNLFGTILHGQISFPHQTEIMELLSIHNKINRSSPHFSSKLSELRKPFMDWLLKYSKTEVSYDNFLLFLHKQL